MTSRPIAVFAALALLVLLAYSNSFSAGFHFDDFAQITLNPYVSDVSNIPRFFVRTDLADTLSRQYRPVTTSSFALNHAVSADSPWSYHAFNIGLHILNAFLLYLVITALFAAYGKSPSLIAFAAAALFALHPVQTDAVTYVSGRAVLLAVFFWLSGFLCFLKFREDGGRSRTVYASTVPFCLLLGLLSKETAVSLPAMMILHDLLRPAGDSPNESSGRPKWPYHAAMVALVGLFFVSKGRLQGFIATPDSPLRVADYLMTEAKVLLLYLRLLVLPINQNFDYYLPRTFAPDAGVAAGAAVVAASLVLAVRYARREPLAVFFGMWFLVTLAPESSLVPIIDVAREYRLYLPSMGLAALAAMLIDRIFRGAARYTARNAVFACILSLFIVLTLSRNRVWSDDVSLWADTAGKAPYSTRAHASLGSALLRDGRYAEAAAELETALRLKPMVVAVVNGRGVMFVQRSEVHADLGECYQRLGRQAEAEEQFRRAAALSVQTPDIPNPSPSLTSDM